MSIYNNCFIFVYKKLGRIYCRGLVCKTIYQSGSICKLLTLGVCFVRGSRHLQWRDGCSAICNGEKEGAAIEDGEKVA